MKKKGKFAEGLSPIFWNSYKLFLKGEMSPSELKKRVVTAEDIFFFQEECVKSCDILGELQWLELKKVNAIIDALFLAMENVDNEAKKLICRKALTIFLNNYSCFAEKKSKRRSNEILLYFHLSPQDVPETETLDEKISEMLGLLLSAGEKIKNREAFIRPAVFKIVCVYAALAVSDKEGKIKCQNLGKEISTKWSKSTPESVTLSCLKKREKDSKLPVSELALLEKYSF